VGAASRLELQPLISNWDWIGQPFEFRKLILKPKNIYNEERFLNLL
jgi:hypothetical protein